MKKQAIRTCKGRAMRQKSPCKGPEVSSGQSLLTPSKRLRSLTARKLTLRMNDFAESVFREYTWDQHAQKRESRTEQKGESDHDMVLTKDSAAP